MLQVNGLTKARQALLAIRAVIKQGDKPTWDKIGKITIKFIVARTLQGKDVSGKTFKSYSDAYAKKKGYKRADLFVKGTLLKAIGRQAHAKSVRIYVKKTKHKGGISSYQLMIVHNDGGRSGRGKGFKMPQREVMGLTKKEENKLRESREKM